MLSVDMKEPYGAIIVPTLPNDVVDFVTDLLSACRFRSIVSHFSAPLCIARSMYNPITIIT